MSQERRELDRREFMRTMLALGAAAGAVLPHVREALAMGAGHQLVEGVRKVQGTVAVNGTPAQAGSLIFPGDVITTGSASLGVFVIGKDAFLVRENTRLELVGDKAGKAPGATKLVRTIRIAAGRMLAVFGPGGKRIETVTAVAGTRGTGMYVDAAPEVTYLCLCYGGIDLEAKAFPGERRSFDTTHHEQPCYILGKGAKLAFLKAPMMDHRDEELVMLEALVGRKPAFGSGGGSAPAGY